MNYYECVEPMTLYIKHDIEKIEVISEKPTYFSSPWLKVITKEGKNFYIEKDVLEEMNKHPELFPLFRKERHMFIKEDKKGSGAGS